jgi:hypothetical protein
LFGVHGRDHFPQQGDGFFGICRVQLAQGESCVNDQVFARLRRLIKQGKGSGDKGVSFAYPATGRAVFKRFYDFGRYGNTHSLLRLRNAASGRAGVRRSASRGLDNGSGTDTAGAEPNFTHGSVRGLMTHCLQVGTETTFGLDIGMADKVACLRRFSAMLAFSGHDALLYTFRTRGGTPGVRVTTYCR